MSLSHPLTQILVDMMLNSFEPLSSDEALQVAKSEGYLANDMTTNDVYASLSRAKYYVLGELIANEYETPDSERMLEHGYTRELAVKNWTEIFTKEV